MFVRIEFESKQLLVKSASAQYNLENTEESFDNNSEVWLYSKNWSLIITNSCFDKHITQPVRIHIYISYHGKHSNNY